MYGIEELIALAAEKRASDVHLIAGLPPKCRIDGRIETLTDGGLTREDCEEYGRQLAGNAADQIEAIGQLDFSASFAGRRLRVNLFRQQGALSAAIRLLGSTIPNLSELGLPEAVNQFSSWNKGIILVTGETGSGKSTTLAAILNEINQNRPIHMITLEDPIEYVYEPAQAIMNQFTYDQQIITNQNMAPRVPGLENMGILDGSETIRTSTGSKEINYYESNSLTDTYYWFGSDSLGRDLWTRTWSGTRISLYVAVLAVFIDLAFGLTYGLVSGYFGGKVDMIMQRIVEILNSIPYLITVTLLLLVMKPGLMSITFALMFSGWLGMSRIARAEVLKLKEQEYVLASRTLGAKSFRIIFKEILPNIFGPLITQTMFSIPHAIFTEAFLAFIGLGVPEPMASLGSLISSGYQNFTSHPYMIVFPLIVMGLLMLCFNMLADGLRDALDPKMKDM